MVKYLCVAEKPSISKSITQILSGGEFNTRQTTVGWIKNYDFSYRLPPGPGHTDFTVTAVAGHLMSSDFGQEYKGWHSCDPFTLFDAPIQHFVNPDKNQKGIEKNLLAEARRATHLMIWTDCDREGEHIGSEVALVCRKANPDIIVSRAKFSAIIANQIHNACKNPVPLDMLQANAVAARIDLDLRVGAALTRTQTMGLQARFGELAEKVISYGPCQFPTLGFVVDQYERLQAFIPEQFWYIHLTLQKEESTVPFLWKRGRLYDEVVVEMLFDRCEEVGEVTVIRQGTKPTQKWKPLPLTTVELQKSGSRLIRMTPKQILDVSDGLYQKGFLSYPRTETDQFDKDFDFDEMIQKQTGDNAWGAFATSLMEGGFERPRNGKKNDKAHPPIHPTNHIGNLEGNDKKVYDLVTRRFLACCSKNARGMETVVEAEIAGEEFTAKGLIISERNYLDVYVYDKWNGNLLPDFVAGETFVPSTCELRDGITTEPSLLTEADLVSLMDKNGIGTDATIAEHINRIIEREYVMKQKSGAVEYLVPSTLGIGLVEGYNAIGFEKSLCKPHLRRQTEFRMNQICEGLKTKQEVIDETLDEYREMYTKTQQEFATLSNTVGRYIKGEPDNAAEDDAPPPPPPPAAGRGGRGGARGAARGRGARGGARGGAAQRQASAVPDNDDDQDDDDDPAGAGAVVEEVVAPMCRCDTEAAQKTVTKETVNKGRKFFACPKGMNDGCGFFEWAPAPGEVAGRAVPQKRARKEEESMEDNGERCNCSLVPARRQVTKAGPNEGKIFFVCPNPQNEQCEYFVWSTDRDLNDAPPSTKPRVDAAGGSTQSGECYHCQQEGHWASQCPTKSTQAAKSTGTGYGADASGAVGGDCYNCGQPGHWTSNCPKPKKAKRPGNAYSNAKFGSISGVTCFKCGTAGHLSTSCDVSGGRRFAAPSGRGRGRGRGRK